MGYTQQYADQSYYLLDSLDVEKLTKMDRSILEESLKLYHEAKDDTSKIMALNGICEKMSNDAWIDYQFLQHALIENALQKNPTGRVKDRLTISLASSLNNLGFIYKQRGNNPEAINCYLKSLKIKESRGDKKGMGVTLNSIGNIYQYQEDSAKTIEYYQKALDLRKEVGDEEGLAVSYNSLGAFYNTYGDSEKALKAYQKSIDLYKKVGNKSGLGKSLTNIGGAYCKLDSIEKGMDYLNQSLQIFTELDNKLWMAYTHNKIAFWVFERKLNDSAEYHAEMALELAQNIRNVENIKRASKILSRVYESQGKGMEALEMFKMQITMRDCVMNEASMRALAQKEAQYEYEKQKAIDDAEHEKVLAIKQEEKEKQQIIMIASIGGLVLVVVFLIFVFNRLRITRKQKQVIEEQKETVERAHQELESKNTEIMDSISYAKRIQSAILPSDRLLNECLKDLFVLYKPKDVVAGDFYWLESYAKASDSKGVLFAAADCTGHGVPGAMVSVVCHNALNRSVREHGLTDPGLVLDKTREIVVQEFEKSEEEVKDGMDIALCSLEGNILKYAGAHNPLWIIRNGELLEYKANKQPIGKFDLPEPYTTHTIELQTNDLVYLFSDGFVDQFGGEKGKKFKTANFKKLLLSVAKEEMKTQQQKLEEAFEQWKGSLEQLDDVCVLGVRV